MYYLLPNKKERRTKSCHFSNPHFVVVKYRKIHSKALCASLIKSYLWTCVKIDLALENCKFTMIQKFIFLSFFCLKESTTFMPKLINHILGVLKNHHFLWIKNQVCSQCALLSDYTSYYCSCKSLWIVHFCASSKDSGLFLEALLAISYKLWLSYSAILRLEKILNFLLICRELLSDLILIKLGEETFLRRG